MPYFGPHSDKLVVEIEKIMGKYFPQIDLRIILVNKNTIGSYFSFKDVLPTLQRSSVIYIYIVVTDVRPPPIWAPPVGLYI